MEAISLGLAEDCTLLHPTPSFTVPPLPCLDTHTHTHTLTHTHMHVCEHNLKHALWATTTKTYVSTIFAQRTQFWLVQSTQCTLIGAVCTFFFNSSWVDDVNLLVGGSYIYNHYMDCKDTDYYLCSDKINDLLSLPPRSAGSELSPVLACQDCTLRVLRVSCCLCVCVCCVCVLCVCVCVWCVCCLCF